MHNKRKLIHIEKGYSEKRNDIVDLWRFIACLAIVSYHLFLIVGAAPFRGSWIYVEFFFIISGYFTMLHFDSLNTDKLDDMARLSIMYTLKKFAAFWPYTILAVIFQCVIEFHTEFDFNLSKEALFKFSDIPFDLFFLGDSHVPALWYLSAMFMVFPIFCMICQFKSKHLLYIISFFAVVFWCRYTDAAEVGDFPMYLVRAFIFLTTGILVYGVSLNLKNYSFRVFWKSIFTVIEQICMIFTLYVTYYDKEGLESHVILCFVVALVLMLSRQTYTSRFRGSAFTWLGKLSMVIYIFHWNVGTIIRVYFPNVHNNQKVFAYYFASVVVSIIIYTIVEKIKKHSNMERIFFSNDT